MAAKGHCSTCNRKHPPGDPRSGGLCPECRDLGLALGDLHKHYTTRCEADHAERAARVERYAAIVESGGTLFEA